MTTDLKMLVNSRKNNTGGIFAAVHDIYSYAPAWWLMQKKKKMYEWEDIPLCIYKRSLQTVLYLLYNLNIVFVELWKQWLKAVCCTICTKTAISV